MFTHPHHPGSPRAAFFVRWLAWFGLFAYGTGSVTDDDLAVLG
jgi:hypothetical protein